MGETVPGPLNKLWHDIKAAWLNLQVLGRSPPMNALHENAAGATDIEERAATVYRLGDKASRGFKSQRCPRDSPERRDSRQQGMLV